MPIEPPLEQFPILEHGLYFNHAAVGPWPRCTAEAVQNFADENMRQGSAAYREWIVREDGLRQGLAELTGAASADDIALLKKYHGVHICSGLRAGLETR